MAKASVVDDILVICPLLKEEIADSYCYEINLVAFGLCKPSLINYVINREEAAPVCGSCENRAMR